MNSKTQDTNKNSKYVVLRGGCRVSELEYETSSDAYSEFIHWDKISKRWPDGTSVTVEPYNESKHKIY